MADPNGPSLERATLAAFPWLVGGLIASVPLLLIPASSDRRWDMIIHLGALVAFGLALVVRLAPLSDERWFDSREWSPTRRRFITAASLIVIVTGVTALVTLASSAAMHYEPSLQFLQLLSALDIAWVVAGTFLAARWLWGRAIALVAGVMMSIVCIASIAAYLAEVGLDASGGWLVDSERMLQLVIPFDIAAALITITLTLIAARDASSDRAGQSPVV
jgi:hypothetical protein